MPKTLITGVAGFIGSHLAERLIKEGFDVIGVDSFEDYYPKWIKEKNIESLLKSPKFTFLEANLLSDNLWNLPLYDILSINGCCIQTIYRLIL